MINTHRLIGDNIIKYCNNKNIYLINSSKFIWGNAKPDFVPKYTFKKHYFNESIDMVLEKIKYLSLFSSKEFYSKQVIEKFSEELGVLCHFLCDFFCAPHYYRWEFKSPNAIKNHVMYENELAKVAKKFIPTVIINETLDLGNIKDFILQLQKQYDGTLDCNNDLTFSYYVCGSILAMILNSVVENNNIISNVI